MNRASVVVIVGIAGSGLVGVLAACSGREGDETSAANAAPLVRAELPRAASLTYEVTQPELGGPARRERLAVSVGPTGRRLELHKSYGDKDERFEILTDRLGATDGKTSADARWNRIEAFSTPAMIGEEQAWDAPFLRDMGTGGSSAAAVVDDRRVFRIVRAWDTPQGRRSRAIVNVRGMIDETSGPARQHGITNENWPMRDSVFGVGVAEYLTVNDDGAGETFLLASAEYRFVDAAPSQELAVTSTSTLQERLAANETVLTLRCLVEGPTRVIEAARASKTDNDSQALVLCNGK